MMFNTPQISLLCLTLGIAPLAHADDSQALFTTRSLSVETAQQAA